MILEKVLGKSFRFWNLEFGIFDIDSTLATKLSGISSIFKKKKNLLMLQDALNS
jgi:hypothetical protein